MSLFLVENNETLNESGGAHKKYAENMVKQRNKDFKKLFALKMLNDDNGPRANKYVKDNIGKLEDRLNNSLAPAVLNDIKKSKKGNPDSKYDDRHDVQYLKKRLGVGSSSKSKEERKEPGLYKRLQDIKRLEAFDLASEYVVGCLEGSIDDFNLDLFTEASNFIIDCLDE